MLAAVLLRRLRDRRNSLELRQEFEFLGMASLGKLSITVEWSTSTCAVSRGMPFGVAPYDPTSQLGLDTFDNKILMHARQDNSGPPSAEFMVGLT